ncbi:MAG: hypothetical protein EBU80_11080, partial [Chitinophagia bacterium]|nr:hypothetical protein [Chitinophagia bacterium]
MGGVNEYSGAITLSTNAVRINTDLNSLLISGNISGGSIPLYFGSSAGSGSVTVTVSGRISGSGGLLTWGTSPTSVPLLTSVVKDNSFLTLVLSSTLNDYSGATVLGSTGNANGGSGAGTLLLGGSEVIANSSNIVFNGGNLSTGGYGETVDTLSLLQDGGTLTLGNSVHELRFSTIGTFDYKTLTISGWQGTAGSTGSGGDIFVGSSLFFTRAQLDQIKFSYNSGTYSAIQLSSGELVPDVNTVSNRANIRITSTSTTSCPSCWSPTLASGTVNTTYIFTPNANNATISVSDIVTMIQSRYSNVTINTTYTGGTQVGQVDFATALTAYNATGNGWQKLLTVNGGGDVNISNAISFGYPGQYAGANTAHSLSVATAGNINVTATISTLGALTYNYNSTQPDGGNVTLNSTAGSVKVTSQITTSGAVSSGNASFGGASGSISITGVGGVSISAALVATGKSGTDGAITISTGNSTVTSGGGVNDGVSSVIGGGNFTKSGAGVLKISGTNTWSGTTTISGGTLQLGSGTNI